MEWLGRFSTGTACTLALVVAVGCSDDDALAIPDLAGEYAMTQVIAGEDQCLLGDTLNVPARIAQSGRNGVLTLGTIPGPETCGATAQGLIFENRLFSGVGETVYGDYFGAGCDLVQSDDWSLSIAPNGQVSGGWTVGFQDVPPGCASASISVPCVNEYTVAGLRCEGCVEACGP